jgi:hypothetical protein
MGANPKAAGQKRDRHGRIYSGHPRLTCGKHARKTWMPGTSPAMTKSSEKKRPSDRLISGAASQFRKTTSRLIAAVSHSFATVDSACAAGLIMRYA